MDADPVENDDLEEHVIIDVDDDDDNFDDDGKVSSTADDVAELYDDDNISDRDT